MNSRDFGATYEDCRKKQREGNAYSMRNLKKQAASEEQEGKIENLDCYALFLFDIIILCQA
jgi:hypothetical protein